MMVGLVPRPPLHVEDHAPATRGADQPFPLSSVAEPERAAADAARGHDCGVARTGDGLSARERVADRPLLTGFEPRRVAGHDTRTTTLPNCSPLSSRSKAARPSAKGNTLSI